MTEEEFIERARGFLRAQVGDKASSVAADTELVTSGILDSLLVLEFFFFLEEVHGSAIDADQVSMASLSTLRSAYQLVAGTKAIA